MIALCYTKQTKMNIIKKKKKKNSDKYNNQAY